MRKLFVYFLWTLLTITVLAVAGAFYAIDKGWIGYMPPIEDLQNPISRFATQIILLMENCWERGITIVKIV